MAKFTDLTGKRFGALTVIERSANNKRGNTMWLCHCDCGNDFVTLGYGLTHGHTKSCGCGYMRKGKPSPRRKNLIGKRYGKLTVIGLDGKRAKNGGLMWICKCDCGNTKSIQAAQLLGGGTNSCGCSQFDNMEKQDIVGKKFGKLTAIKRVKNKGKHLYYLFKCDCGNEKIISKEAVVEGKTKSCGCLSHKSPPNFKDLTGQSFGRLTVIKRADDYVSPSGNVSTQWFCKCDCGNTTIVGTSSLTLGVTSSCGCKAIEITKELCTTHGMTHTRIYHLYYSMRARCYNPDSTSYKKYGAKGITVCDEWLGENGFINFCKWAMANGYEEHLTIDRIDGTKGYSPDNCRWATYKEQANNTKATVFLTYNGETKPASEWSEITGLSQSSITHRKRKGWTDEECLTIKPHGRRKE